MPTRSTPTSPSCNACSPGSSHTGPTCRSVQSSPMEPTMASTGRRRPGSSAAAHRLGHQQAATEAEWLPRLAPHPPLKLPVQLARGHPAEGPSLRLVGVSVAARRERPRHDRRPGAGGRRPRRLCEGAPPGRCHRRPSPSPVWPRRTAGPARRACPSIDLPARRPHRRRRYLRAWEKSLHAPPWDGADVWVHGDCCRATC